MIAFYGYDGFLYSIGYLAGWVVALFVIAEPLKRLGKFTFADALDKQLQQPRHQARRRDQHAGGQRLLPDPADGRRGHARSSRCSACRPLGRHPELHVGRRAVGLIVILIVVTAGMVSTTWVQFIKGSLLVVFCFILTIMILRRGLAVQQVLRLRRLTVSFDDNPVTIRDDGHPAEHRGLGRKAVPPRDAIRDGRITVWRESPDMDGGTCYATYVVSEIQWQTVSADGKTKTVNGRPWGTHREKGEADFWPVGQVAQLPDGKQATGPLGPLEYLRTLQDSTIVTWGSDTIKEPDGSTTTVYYQKPTKGSELLTPGELPRRSRASAATSSPTSSTSSPSCSRCSAAPPRCRTS